MSPYYWICNTSLTQNSCFLLLICLSGRRSTVNGFWGDDLLSTSSSTFTMPDLCWAPCLGGLQLFRIVVDGGDFVCSFLTWQMIPILTGHVSILIELSVKWVLSKIVLSCLGRLNYFELTISREWKIELVDVMSLETRGSSLDVWLDGLHLVRVH